MVLAGDLVPTGTTLVTPALEFHHSVLVLGAWFAMPRFTVVMIFLQTQVG